MAKLNPDNAFPGAQVKYRDKKWFVLKINQKTVYISQNVNLTEWWKDRPKGLTLKKFCEKYDAIMIGYETITIDEAEIEKGKKFANAPKTKGKKKSSSEIFAAASAGPKLY